MYVTRLKALRERGGLTQKEVGALINLDSGTYSNYENEELLMPTKHLNTLCNYFNVSIDYIFEFTDIKQYKNSTKEIDKILVGKRIKEFRQENKLTQVKLATILKTVHPVITNYENGKHLIAMPFLYTICSKYNISADYILGKINEPKYLNKS